MAKERGTISPGDKLCALGWETQRDRATEEGKDVEDVIYTCVTPKPADGKSHHVRARFDAYCPQMRQQADILLVRRLFNQCFWTGCTFIALSFLM